MNRREGHQTRGSSASFPDLILNLVLTAAVLAAWMAGFASLGGV